MVWRGDYWDRDPALFRRSFAHTDKATERLRNRELVTLMKLDALLGALHEIEDATGGL